MESGAVFRLENVRETHYLSYDDLDLKEFSRGLQTLLIIFKRATIQQITRSLDQFGQRVNANPNLRDVDTSYDANPQFRRNGTFSGRIIVYFPDIRMYNLMIGLSPHGEKRIPPHLLREMEQEYEQRMEEARNIYEDEDGFSWEESNPRPLSESWCFITELEEELNEKYAHRAGPYFPRPTLVVNEQTLEMDFSYMGIDYRASSGADPHVVFVRNTSEELSYEDLDRLLFSLCYHPYQIECKPTFSGNRYLIHFDRSGIDSHRFFHIYKRRKVQFGGREIGMNIQFYRNPSTRGGGRGRGSFRSRGGTPRSRGASPRYRASGPNSPRSPRPSPRSRRASPRYRALGPNTPRSARSSPRSRRASPRYRSTASPHFRS